MGLDSFGGICSVGRRGGCGAEMTMILECLLMHARVTGNMMGDAFGGVSRSSCIRMLGLVTCM